MTVRLGIIGAGDIARKHLDVIRDMEEVRAVGITSRTMSKAQTVAKDYEIPVCASDLNTLIKEARPDALMVLVSFEEMYVVTKRAIDCGLPLFIEKPPGLTPGETKHLVELAEAHKVKTMVGYNRRYYSIFHQGLEIIKKQGPLLGVKIEGHERFWKLAYHLKEPVRSQWVYANSTHTIDLMRFFGGEPSEINAIGHSFIEKNGDQFAALMQLSSGAVGQYLSFWYSPGGWSVVLYGKGVTVDFKPLESGRWMDEQFNTHEILPDDKDIKYKPGFYKQMEAFVSLVNDGKLPWPGLDLEGAYQTMLLAQKITEISESGKGLK